MGVKLPSEAQIGQNKEKKTGVYMEICGSHVDFGETASNLRSVDRVEIISLQDNMVEALCTTDGKNVFTAGQWVRIDQGEDLPLTMAEHGFSPGRVKKEGRWHPEPEMADDRGLVIHIKGKGLVVISGCAHSGIVNNLLYARKLTLERLPRYAVLGGFHLAGPKFEPRISSTVAAVKDFHPSFVIPSHCTGWKAMYRFAREIPHAFVYPGTGKLYRFFSG